MRRHCVASTSVQRHVPAGNLPPMAPQYSKPSYAYAHPFSDLYGKITDIILPVRWASIRRTMLSGDSSCFFFFFFFFFFLNFVCVSIGLDIVIKGGTLIHLYVSYIVENPILLQLLFVKFQTFCYYALPLSCMGCA